MNSPAGLGGGGCGRSARPVRRAAAHWGAGPRYRPSPFAGYPAQPCLLDQEGGQWSSMR